MMPLFEELALLAAVKLPDDALMTISATQIPFEVELGDWLRLRSKAAGYDILEVESGASRQGQTVHAAAIAGRNGLRMFAANNGSVVVLLTATMPANASEHVREVIGAVASSFEFAQPSGSATLEPVVKYADPSGLFSVAYPASWTACPVEALPGVSALNLRLLDEAGEAAHIHCEANTLHSRGDTGVRKVLEALLEDASAAGVTISSLDTGKDGRLEGEYEADGVSGPCLVALRPAGKTWLAVMALFPAQESDAWLWLRARRAFDIVASTLDTP
ncbi:MAG TPA: hypothetical protein VN428_13950 [Bryobacteraceae bacterium]|nr:hypothetical protein [Bryobacteraceae bacterium]